jgi:hypothetical protein
VTKLTLYHQVRVDGGERTGVDCGDTEVLHGFQPGSEEPDPALLWFVDVRCEGDRLPDDSHGAREWFLAHDRYFVGLLARIAHDQLEIGCDSELRPYTREYRDGPNGARVEIVVSAARRMVGREIAKKVEELAHQWRAVLESLEPLSVV